MRRPGRLLAPAFRIDACLHGPLVVIPSQMAASQDQLEAKG